jgi:hypothetical protein
MREPRLTIVPVLCQMIYLLSLFFYQFIFKTYKRQFMTVKQLRAFLAVAQTLSFTQACERLHLSHRR